MRETLPEKAVPAAIVFFLALALLPAIMFGALTGLGVLGPGHALLAWGIYGVVAAGFGLALGRDLVVMTQLLRALRTNPEALPNVSGLFVPGMRALGEEAMRMAKAIWCGATIVL